MFFLAAFKSLTIRGPQLMQSRQFHKFSALGFLESQQILGRGKPWNAEGPPLCGRDRLEQTLEWRRPAFLCGWDQLSGPGSHSVFGIDFGSQNNLQGRQNRIEGLEMASTARVTG